MARQQKTRGADDDEVRSSDKASRGFTGQLFSRQANIKDPLLIAFNALEHDNRLFFSPTITVGVTNHPRRPFHRGAAEDLLDASVLTGLSLNGVDSEGAMS